MLPDVRSQVERLRKLTVAPERQPSGHNLGVPTPAARMLELFQEIDALRFGLRDAVALLDLFLMQHNDEPILKPEDVERIEIWLDETDQRWYGRAVDGAGTITATTAGFPQEHYLLDAAEAEWPGVPVFQIRDQLEDSRNIQVYGPPQRLWGRQPEATS